MTPAEQAQNLLTPARLHHVNLAAATESVAAALAEKDAEIIYWKANHAAAHRMVEQQMKATDKMDDMECTIEEQKKEIALLTAQNDRLHALFPTGQPCACNYDEPGAVCEWHRAYLDRGNRRSKDCGYEK